MEKKSPRPPSVWVTQGLVAIFGVIMLVFWVPGIIQSLGNGDLKTRSLPLVFSTVVTFSMIALFIATFWQLMKRRKSGRWLGVASLFLIWIILVYSQLFPRAGPTKPYEFSNTAERAGGFFGQALVHCLFLIPLLRLSFAKKVEGFFVRDETPASNEVD